MDWEQIRERTLGEVGEALVTEGGGVAVGFVGASFIGRQSQNIIATVYPGASDTGISANPWVNGPIAWIVNNAPKAAIWYLTKSYAIEPGEVATPAKEAISDARKAFAGSIVFDTLMRLANGGPNPASASIYGWQVLGSGQSPETQKAAQADVQRLIQENSALRTELNKALQRLASQPVAPQMTQPAAQPVIQPAVHQQPVIQQPPAPTVVMQAPAPRVVAQPISPAPTVVAQPAPPVVRYTPVTPYSVPPYGSPIPPYSTPAAKPVARPAPRPVARPVVKVEENPPVVRAEEIYSQPTPPHVQERQRRFGAMQYTPPHIQHRQKKYGFMAGEEKDIAQVFGML